MTRKDPHESDGSPARKPDCFIIMPITTHEPGRYGGDPDHWRHVLEHLFIPAVTAAGFNPISPKADGADVIHAGIIRNLEQADLVLCDMSELNPNVFFELGVRTAVDKPACIVRDDLTHAVPFDVIPINHYTYSNTLHPWALAQQVAELSAHAKASAASGGRNSLWRYFGLTSRAELDHGVATADDRLEILSLQMASIDQGVRNLLLPTQAKGAKLQQRVFHLMMDLGSVAEGFSRSLPWVSQADDGSLDFTFRGSAPSPVLIGRLRVVTHDHGFVPGRIFLENPAGGDDRIPITTDGAP